MRRWRPDRRPPMGVITVVVLARKRLPAKAAIDVTRALAIIGVPSPVSRPCLT